MCKIQLKSLGSRARPVYKSPFPEKPAAGLQHPEELRETAPLFLLSERLRLHVGLEEGLAHWEMPRDCNRWKVAPKAQPVSMLFTFFVSC